MVAVSVRNTALSRFRSNAGGRKYLLRNGLTWALVLAVQPSRAEPSRTVRILGSASVSATVSVAPPLSPTDSTGITRIEGRVTDDAGKGIASATLTLASRDKGGAPPQWRIEACEGPKERRSRIETDQEGRFCILVSGVSWQGAQLRYEDPNGLLGHAELELPSQIERPEVELSWAQTTPEVPLDVPLHAFELAASPPREDSKGVGELPVELGLESPHGGLQIISRGFVRPGERARFEVQAQALGKPGSAELIARLTGTMPGASGEARQRITKTAQVTVRTTETSLRVRSGEDLVVPVSAVWQRGSVMSGTVEARFDDVILTVAELQDGSARLMIPAQAISSDRKSPTTGITLHYVPSAPWWKAGQPTRVPVEILPASPWSRLPWFVAAVALFVWVGLIWKRPAPRARVLSRPPVEPPGRESLLVEEATGNALGGQVLDAHTGEPVAGARILVTAAGVERATELADVATDPEGRFALELPEPSASPRTLQVSAPGYGELSRPLPRRGHLVIHVVTLRRSLLDRLVGWAERKGAPWYGRHAPTPAEVAATAKVRSVATVEHWATDIEAAAFGPEEPSPSTERRLRDAEPP